MPKLSPEEVLHHLAIESPDEIDLDIIACHLGIEIIRGKLDSAEARLTAYADGDKAIIRINNQSSPERQRFSIGHELGHWYYDRKAISCSRADISGALSRGKNIVAKRERRADEYAAKLLMPEKMFKPRLREHNRITHDLVSNLATEFRTSEISTAIRCAEMNTDLLMVVVTRNNKPKLYCRAKDIDSRYWPRGWLTNETLASKINEGRECGEVSADAWFDDNELSRHTIFEDTIRLGDTLLTLLSFDDEIFLGD